MVVEAKQQNNKRNIKKFLILLSILISIITIYEISKIFAVFYSEVTKSSSADIARWVIIVNDEDIVAETVQPFQAKFNIENGKSVNGKLAPGATGCFDIVIEPKTTQVAVRYDITIDLSDIEDTNVNLISIEETEADEVTIIRTGENTYTGIIPLDSIKDDYFNNIKITFKWDAGIDIESSGIFENTKPLMNIPMSVKVSQYMGEEIKEYTD